EFNDHDINLQLDQLNGADISEVRLRRLYLDQATQAPVLQIDTLSASPNQLTMKAEESIMIEYVFANSITQQDSLWEDRFFAQEYLRPITAGQAVQFSFQNVSTPSVGTASLRLGIGRAHGLSLQPQLSINGTNVPVPTDWMGYDQATRQNFFGVIEVPFDVSLLTSQTNIEMIFPDQGGHIASALIHLSSPDITITALDPDHQQATLQVYPNPASSKLEIMLPEELRDSFTLELIDLKGKQVWFGQFPREASQQGLSLDLKNQAPGMYLLRLQSGDLIFNEKIIIQ
ncbi:MAG: T9SS type A sorting domain-containing protein, partial [Bacteroidota bacterium]